MKVIKTFPVIFMLLHLAIVSAGADGCTGNERLQQAERQAGYRSSESSAWFPAKRGTARAAALVIHGLNQKPSKWRQVIDLLNDRQVHVFRLTLKGHGGAPFEDMQTVDAQKWRANFQAGYCELEKRYPQLDKLLVAYSLGALVAQEVQLSSGKSMFARQILLAPALRLQPYVAFIRPLTHIFATIPSRTPRPYRANSNGTASAAYRAMFTLLKSFRNQKDSQSINVPTLVLMHPEDEVVSHHGILAVIQNRGLDQWQHTALVHHQGRIKPAFKHMIIDRHSLGDPGWSDVSRQIIAFLEKPLQR